MFYKFLVSFFTVTIFFAIVFVCPASTLAIVYCSSYCQQLSGSACIDAQSDSRCQAIADNLGACVGGDCQICAPGATGQCTHPCKNSTVQNCSDECYYAPGNCYYLSSWLATTACSYIAKSSGTPCTGGTCDGAGHCVVQTIVCNSNSQCGTSGYIGSPFCQNGDVYQTYKTYTCNNPGTPSSSCSSSDSNQVKTDCTSNQTCNNGACVDQPVACSTNAQCGTNGYTGSPYCQNGNVYKNYRTYTCFYPGTVNAECRQSNTAKLFQECSNTQTCNNGACVDQPVRCSTNAQCGTDGFTSNPFCKNNSVYRNYITYLCQNPGTTQSYCHNYTTENLISACLANQTCINGVCQNDAYHCSGQKCAAGPAGTGQVSCNGLNDVTTCKFGCDYKQQKCVTGGGGGSCLANSGVPDDSLCKYGCDWSTGSGVCKQGSSGVICDPNALTDCLDYYCTNDGKCAKGQYVVGARSCKGPDDVASCQYRCTLDKKCKAGGFGALCDPQNPKCSYFCANQECIAGVPAASSFPCSGTNDDVSCKYGCNAFNQCVHGGTGVICDINNPDSCIYACYAETCGPNVSQKKFVTCDVDDPNSCRYYCDFSSGMGKCKLAGSNTGTQPDGQGIGIQCNPTNSLSCSSYCSSDGKCVLSYGKPPKNSISCYGPYDSDTCKYKCNNATKKCEVGGTGKICDARNPFACRPEPVCDTKPKNCCVCQYDTSAPEDMAVFKNICSKQKSGCDTFKIIDDKTSIESAIPSSCTSLKYTWSGHGRGSESLAIQTISCINCTGPGCKVFINNIGCSVGQKYDEVMSMAQQCQAQLQLTNDSQTICTNTFNQARAVYYSSGEPFNISKETITITSQKITDVYAYCSQLGARGACQADSYVAGEYAKCTDDATKEVVTKKCCISGSKHSWITVKSGESPCPGEKAWKVKFFAFCKGSSLKCTGSLKEATANIVKNCDISYAYEEKVQPNTNLDNAKALCNGPKDVLEDNRGYKKIPNNDNYVVENFWTCKTDITDQVSIMPENSAPASIANTFLLGNIFKMISNIVIRLSAFIIR